VWWKLHDPNFNRFWLIHPFDGQTDRKDAIAMACTRYSSIAYMLSRVNTGSTIITELRYLWNENPLLQLSTVTLRLQLIALILYYGTTKTLASLANVQNIQNGWRLIRAIYRRRRQMSPQYARHAPSGPLVNRWRLIRWIWRRTPSTFR